MSMNDPIADYLTRIRNAILARHSKVDVPASRMITAITQILLDEGYIKNYTKIDNEHQSMIRIYLKYNKDGKNVITNLKRVSRPGFRQYAKVRDLPRVLNGLGTAIISTPKGIVTEKQARRENVGGEIICYVW